MKASFYKINTLVPEMNSLCEFIEALYRDKKRIIIFAPDETFAKALDEALWQFKEASFIPHNLEGEGPTPPPPVHIVYQKLPNARFTHLINLSDKLPDNPRLFEEIIEFVPNDEAKKILMRQHYRHYQTLNFQVAFKDKFH